ncbi:hypothetical protein [Nocardioides sp. 503]|uniref:hypothetical protein n=1 Tax=Nocardioides sp. 503 TaxID=2508326 RepID=UPI00106FEBE8|nr:hypothetical protein [Nocardioides sp. 503]
MNVDELLREAAPDPELARARTDRLRARVLTRATRTSAAPARRRTVRATAAALTLGLGALGGVAYATGTVPPVVSSLVDQFARDAEIPAAQRPEMTQVVDLELPDGSRFAAWRGVSDEMWCTAYTDRWDGRQLDNGAVSCGDQEAGGYDLNRVQVAWAQDRAGTSYYPVAFGEADAGAVEVRITGTFAGTGEPVDLRTPVDARTLAFATVLPGSERDPWAHLEGDGVATPRDSGIVLTFLGRQGEVLRSVPGPPV